MVFRKRFVPRKNRRMVRRRKFIKRAHRPRKFGGNPTPVYYFKRFCELTTITAGADGSDVLVARPSRLDDLPNYTEFTALYDFYKIVGVKVRMLPFFDNVPDNDAGGVFSATYSSPSNLRIFSILDYNTLTPPTTINDMRQYQNCKVSRYVKGHKRYFVPKPVVEADSDLQAIQIFSGKRNPWINTTYPSIDHFGLSVGIDASNLDPSKVASGDPLLRLEATYYVCFKNPK